MPAPEPVPAPAAAGSPASSSVLILRFLRVTLHVGFALLLTIAVVRLLTTVQDGPARWALLAVAVLLALVFLAGTVLEKRYAAGLSALDPGRYAIFWLATVTALWGVLLAGSAEFSWLAFPLFFLHIHVLPRRLAIVTVALMTAAVIASQWAASGLAVPAAAAVVGPVLGAVFSIATGIAYRALYLEGELQRRAADELRRTRAELARTQHDAGVLAERERLAREIHDTLAQGFSSIVLLSRAADKSLSTGDPFTARNRLAMVQQTAADSLAEARNFVRGLSSPQLQESSLVESLRRLCEKTETEAAARGVGLRCRFELDGEPVELPQPYQVTLLRAAQSSLANVWLHAKAGTAVVTLSSLGSEVTMDIYDDGVGFDPAPAPARADGSGYGLRYLRERVGAQNGTLALESAPGEGTVVALRLPLEPAVPPDRGDREGAGLGNGVGDGDELEVVDRDSAVRDGPADKGNDV
ncbi:sensor histidine kinase [Arthrobacter sp. A5]|uniref:sensor histidine kinase n=1 Tax=Arthrobacter sp. A5 TaxID=576926 RepID=UPI003DAA0962